MNPSRWLLASLTAVAVLFSGGCNTVMTPSPPAAAPRINISSITPATVDYRSSTRVTVEATADIPSGTQVYLSPGGPTLSHTFPGIGAVDFVAGRRTRSGEMLIIAASQSGQIHLLQFTGKAFTLLSTHSTGRPVSAIHLEGDTLAVAVAGLDIYRISRDTSLEFVQRYESEKSINAIKSDASNFYLLAENRYIISVNRTSLKATTTDAGSDKRLNSIAIRSHYGYATGPDTGLGVFALEALSNPLLSWLDSAGTSGTGEQVTLHGPHAWVADGDNGTVVFDISVPGKLRWHGSHNKAGSVSSLIPKENLIITNNAAGRLTSLKTHNTELPVTGSFFKSGHRFNDMIPDRSASKGDTGKNQAIFAATDAGLVRVDFTVAAINQISDEGINLGGSRRAIIRDNIAYVADWFSGLHLYDISQPGHLRHLGNYKTPGSSKGVVLKDHYAIVADDDHGLQFIDISNPANPVWVAELLSTGLAYTMKLTGDRLYLADHRGGFHIIDVSNIRQPKHLAAYDTRGKSWAIDVVGSHAFVADDTSGLLVFDISDIQQIKQIGQFNPGGQAEDVLIRDGIAYVTFFDKGLYLLDINNPSDPTALSHLPIPGNARSIKLQPRNGKLFGYIAGWESGLQVIDVTDPLQPFIAGSLDTSGSAWGADVAGVHAFVWDWWGGVKAVNINNPARPELVGQYQSQGIIEKLSVSGNYMHAASGSGGLQVFDINNPLNPIWVTGVDLPGYTQDVATTQLRAVAALGKAGIAVLDISRPFYISRTGMLATSHPVVKVRALDSTAYALDHQGNLLVIDISQPNKPKLAGTHALKLTDLWLDDGWLFSTGPGTSLQMRHSGERFRARANSVYGGGGGVSTSSSAASVARSDTKANHARQWSLVRAFNDAVAVYEYGNGIHLFSRNGAQLKKTGTLAIKSRITDMALQNNQLMVFGPDTGLVVADISNLTAPVITTQYPATGNHKGFALNGAAAFFTGEPTLSSTDLLPAHPAQPENRSRLVVNIPGEMPLGFYHLNILQPGGQLSQHSNAIRVRPRPRKKPKFSMEDFRKIMELQKQQNPARNMP